MSISSRITSMEEHIGNAYQGLQNIGADITGVNKNIENISSMLEEAYKEAPKVSDTGTDITLDNTRKGRVDMEFSGNTSQFTTTGKNLLPNDTETKTRNGITITKNSDGTYKVNGTATDDFSEAICNNFIPMSGTWRMLGCPSGGSDSTYMLSAYVGYWGAGSPNIDTGSGTNITYTGNVKVRFYIKSGTTCNNLIFKPMLTTDTTATINNFEPYTGGQASPNPDYPQEVHIVRGDNKINVCGKNLFDKSKATLNKGVSTSTGGLYNSDINFSTEYIEVETNGTYYTASGVSSVANKVYGAQYDSNKQYIGGISTNAGVKTFYISNANTKYIRLTGLLEEIDTYQLEKGSTATTYEPFNGNTYNIDLPVENLYEGSQDFSGTWNNSDYWVTDSSTYNDLVVKKRDGQWSGLSKDIQVESGKTYTCSLYVKSDSTRPFAIYSSGGTATCTPADKNFTSTTSWQRYSMTFVANSTGTIRLRIENTSSNVGNYTYICGYQLEVGDKMNSYTPYGITPIELAEISTYNDEIFRTSGKNLCNGINQSVYLNNDVNRCGIASDNSGLYIPVNGGNYTISTLVSQTRYRVACSNDLPPSVSSAIAYNGQNKDNTSNSITINTTGYNYLIVNATDLSAIQIEKGTTATEYNPYGTGEWYYKEAIKKVVLNGTETISAFDATSLSGSYQATFEITTKATSTDKIVLSDYFASALLSDRTSKTNIIYTYSDGYLRLATNLATTVADFKAWLGTHNTIVYYVLATPTNTEITYQPLIDQLNLLEKAQSKENQTNISQVNNDLPFIISASAFLNNLNGKIALLNKLTEV